MELMQKLKYLTLNQRIVINNLFSYGYLFAVNMHKYVVMILIYVGKKYI